MTRLLATIVFSALAIMWIGAQPAAAQIDKDQPTKLCLVHGPYELGLPVPDYFTTAQCQDWVGRTLVQAHKKGAGAYMQRGCINPPPKDITLECTKDWNTCGWDHPECTMSKH